MILNAILSIEFVLDSDNYLILASAAREDLGYADYLGALSAIGSTTSATLGYC